MGKRSRQQKIILLILPLKKKFPHFNLLSHDVPSNGAQGTREKALAIIRARQA